VQIRNAPHGRAVSGDGMRRKVSAARLLRDATRIGRYRRRALDRFTFDQTDRLSQAPRPEMVNGVIRREPSS
jgi:hypothetical protein